MRELAQREGVLGLPAGTVTFLLTDIESSTLLWEAEPAAMAAVVPRHYELIADAVESHRGVRPIEQGEGDSTVAAFERASDALAAAVDGQRALLAEHWPGGVRPRVRMALHTAEAQLRDAGNYQGVALSRGARLREIANGGQIVLSHATRELVADALSDGLGLVDLGVHRLRDLARAERVFGVAHPDLPAGGPLRSLDSRPNNLPVALTSFVGRVQELDQIARALSETRLLTLTGAGGCGKTRLALHAGAAALDCFEDGVWWVELAPVAGPEVVVRAVAQALRVQPLPGADDLDAAVLYLQPRTALVVLDNCEHVLDQAANVALALLERCPGVTVLATSREPLRLAGETDWRVPSLSLPPDGAPTTALASADAAQLFVDRASKVRPNLKLGQEAAATVAQICRALDGIPLALELAAARVRVLSLEQIAAGLAHRFRLLTGGAHGALPRQQTLRASVDWSHELLSDAERVLFRRLAVFADGFTLDATEQVCHDDLLPTEQVLDVLASLVEKSLVQADDADPAATRYMLLETVRQYAIEQLSAAGELTAARDRHRDTYLAWAWQVDGQMYTPQQGAMLDALDAESANLTSAIEWAAATDPAKALELCDALTNWWRLRGMYRQGDAAYARALAATNGSTSVLRARVLAARGMLLSVMGASETATDLGNEALEIAEAADDQATMARALWTLGLASIPSDPAAIHAAAERGAALALEAGDGFAWRANAWLVGWVHYVREEGAQARRLVEEVLRDADDAHDRFISMWARYVLAMPSYAVGDHQRSRQLLEQAVAVARALGEVLCEANSLAHIGLIDSHLGADRVGLDDLVAARDRAVHAGVGIGVAWMDLATGVAAASVGQLERARTQLQELSDLPVLPLILAAWTAVELAEAKRLTRDREAAIADAERALELAGRLPNPWLQARAQNALGRLLAERGEWGEADRIHHQALDAISEGDFRLELPGTLEALAHVAAGLESLGEAARLLGAADRARRDLGFVAWKHQREEHAALVARVREALGDEEFETASAEGAELDPDEAMAWARRARGSRKRPTGGWESLTPTELDVVRHATGGLTNAETAARMFIAPGTVKVHLSHIYAKLGVRNRAELTRQAARHMDSD
jgi:predicted ATPase/DNA-binding CsgD family transcriptional regulator